MMRESDTSFNKGYAYFYDMFYEKKNYNHELDCIKKVLKERKLDLNGKQILEIGCGTGNFSVNLQPNNSLIAIDASSEMIKIAKNKFKYMRSNFHQLSISEFNLLNNDSKQFDVIILLFHVFSYLSMSDVGELKELVEKHLSNNGILILDYWDRSGISITPPTITTKEIIKKDSIMIRTATPLTTKRFHNYTEYSIEIVINKKKLGEPIRICTSEIHCLRAYDSQYIDRIMGNLNCVGNIDLLTGKNYQGENYGNCKFFVK
jgi:2-polyprenyl-3-methyl-5-hydroxy-6-metoxy-1,4-benzoquinol methylase